MRTVDSTSRQRPKPEHPASTEQPADARRQVPRPFMTSFLEHVVRNRIITEEVAREAADWKRKNEKARRSITELLKEEFGLSPDVLHFQIA